MLEEGAVGITIRVSDRFGDHGVVGLAIAKPKGHKKWLIDTFLMSCRVIGRKIEYGMLHAILTEMQQANRVDKVIGEYILSEKNSQVKHFYSDAGFKSVNDIFEFVIGADSVDLPDFLELQYMK